MKTYEVCGKQYEYDDAERQLSALFLDMASDLDIDYGDDDTAWRTFFNDWTDMLCKDGLICESSYQDLCPIGEQFGD
jgi:hypothetical protein